MKTTLGLCSVSLAAVLAGCSSQPKPQPLTPQAFVAPQQSPPPSQPDNPNLGGGAKGDNARPAVQIPDNQVSNTINHALGQGNPPARTVVPAGPRPTDVAPAPNPNATTTTGRAVASPAVGPSSGQYMVLDGTVAEVNGTPIYASKLISYLEKPLREKAKQLDRESYTRQARNLIEMQRTSMIQEELAYAAAQRNLDPDDHRLADAATTMWRIKQISRAGGSLELARRAALNEDPPIDFDEKTRLQNRTELINLYYQKKIFPRLQVTAADIRDYYNRNVDKEFTTNDQVTFRLLKVEIAKTGSKDAALAKITDKWKRAKAGEDFNAMALRENDEKMFAGEKPFEIAPSSFAIAPVRDALMKLKVGEVSDILEDRGAFYLVKIEKRIVGRVEPFDEQKVQEGIRYKLKQLQFANLRNQELDRLSREAAVHVEPRMDEIAMDMAMQIYAQNARR